LGHQLLPEIVLQLAKQQQKQLQQEQLFKQQQEQEQLAKQQQQQQEQVPRHISQIQLVQQQLSRSESSSPTLDLQCLSDDGVNPCVAACLSMAAELFPMLQLPELVVLLVALLAMKRILPSS